MSIECPECGEHIAPLPKHVCHQGGDIIKELAMLRNWHTEIAETRVNVKKKAKHMARAHLVQNAIRRIKSQAKIIAQNAEPFTDPNRKNYISR